MLQTESEGHGLWADQHPDNGGGVGQGTFIPDGAKSKSNGRQPAQLVDTGVAIFARDTRLSPLNESNCFLKKKEQEAHLPTNSAADTLCHDREHSGHQQGSSGSWDRGTSPSELLASISPLRLVWQARAIRPAAAPLPTACQDSGSGAAGRSPLFSLRAPPFLALSRAAAKKAKGSSV